MDSIKQAVGTATGFKSLPYSLPSVWPLLVVLTHSLPDEDHSPEVATWAGTRSTDNGHRNWVQKTVTFIPQTLSEHLLFWGLTATCILVFTKTMRKAIWHGQCLYGERTMMKSWREGQKKSETAQGGKDGFIWQDILGFERWVKVCLVEEKGRCRRQQLNHHS